MRQTVARLLTDLYITLGSQRLGSTPLAGAALHPSDKAVEAYWQLAEGLLLEAEEVCCLGAWWGSRMGLGCWWRLVWHRACPRNSEPVRSNTGSCQRLTEAALALCCHAGGGRGRCS